MLRKNTGVHRPCKNCGKSFEKKTKRQTICGDCRREAWKIGGETRQKGKNLYLKKEKTNNRDKASVTLDPELRNGMVDAIKEIERGNFVTCTQNNFIRKGIQMHIDLVLHSKRRGETFEQ